MSNEISILGEFISKKEEPLGFEEIHKNFETYTNEELLGELHKLNLQGKIGILTFSNKTSQINERKLKVDYVKTKKSKEKNEEKDKEQTLNEMTEKLNQLKAKEKEMDKIIQNYKSKENKFTLLHKYNHIKEVGSEILGKLAEIQQKSITELFKDYDLDSND